MYSPSGRDCPQTPIVHNCPQTQIQICGVPSDRAANGEADSRPPSHFSFVDNEDLRTFVNNCICIHHRGEIVHKLQLSTTVHKRKSKFSARPPIALQRGGGLQSAVQFSFVDNEDLRPIVDNCICIPHRVLIVHKLQLSTIAHKRKSKSAARSPSAPQREGGLQSAVPIFICGQ